MACRKFLFLQGAATPFFSKLAAAVRQLGHEAYRINFCGGDTLLSPSPRNWRFSQPLHVLPDWLEAKHRQHGFTDALVFGDTRPVHVDAIKTLRRLGVRIHVFEEGYLRPNWITLEQDGVNGYSSLLNRPAEFWQIPERELAEAQETRLTGRTFGVRALYDIGYRLANGLLKPLYPHYHTHRPVNALFEYAGWAIRLPYIKLLRNLLDQRNIQGLIHTQTPYYLLPLQLDSDAQIRVHSPFDSVEHSMLEVMTSFAQHAPTNSKLVIKNHPLATGLLDHEDQAADIAAALGISDRVIFLESGNLPELLENTRGTVLVNSTTGTSALYHGSPTCVLGTAIFNLPGLTFQHGLDRFWQEGEAPDRTLYRHFRLQVIRHTQVNGDLYTRQGIKLAVAGSLQRMGVAPVAVPAKDPAIVATTTVTSEFLPIPSYGGSLPEKSYLYKKR